MGGAGRRSWYGACFVCLCFGAISLRGAVRSHFFAGGFLILLVGLLRVPCRHYETLIARFTRYSIHGIWSSLPFLFVSLSLLSALAIGRLLCARANRLP